MNMKHQLRKAACILLAMVIFCASSIQTFAVDYVTDFEEGGYLGYSYTAHLRADPISATASVSYQKKATLRVDMTVTLGSACFGTIYDIDTDTHTERNAYSCRTTWNRETNFLALCVDTHQYINGDSFMRGLYVSTAYLQSVEPDLEVQ